MGSVMKIRLATAVLAALLPAGAATAQDFFVYGGAAIEYERDPNGPGSEDTRDINAYVEVEKSGFFAGVWAEKARDKAYDKADVYIGYRSETAGGLSYYVDATRRTYFNDVGDYTVFDAGLGYSFTDKLSGSVDYSHYIDPDLNDLYLGLAYAVTDKLSVSASYGSYGVAEASDEQEWDFGATYALGEETAVDVRYYDGTEYVDGYLGVSLTWDTTFLSR